MQLSAFLFFSVFLAIGLDGKVVTGQQPAKPLICHHVNHNVPGNCQTSNLGPNCDYCYEKAEIPQDPTTHGDCKRFDATPGRCKSEGYPVCCHDPWPGQPNKLRLAFWNKPGTICASLPVGNVPCPYNGNPIIGAIKEYRERQREFRQSRQEAKEKAKKKREELMERLVNPYYRPERRPIIYRL